MSGAATVAACLIVRDGATTIRRAIDSIRPHVDEVCVLDTGSTDATIEMLDDLAAGHGAPIHVERATWCDDYAKARNQSFAMASSDYLAWFDDDEILDGPLKPWLADQPDVVWVRRTDIWQARSIKCEFRDRVYARELGPCWHSPIHEWVDFPEDARKTVARPDITRVIHHPHDVEGRHNHRAHVERAYAKQPTRHLAFYLAMFAYIEAANGTGDWATAADALRGVMEMPPDPHRPFGGVQEIESALRWLSVCLDQLGDPGGAWLAEAHADGVGTLLANERRDTAELDRMFPLEYDPAIARLISEGTYAATGQFTPVRHDGAVYAFVRLGAAPVRP